jgi:hypothetical protein
VHEECRKNREPLFSREVSCAFSDDAAIVIGAGHFGKRAVEILSSRYGSALWVVDRDEQALTTLDCSRLGCILNEGVLFLITHFHLLRNDNIVVPAVPLHLAFEWLKAYQDKRFVIHPLPVPGKMKPLMPHSWDGRDGSLLVSYADFRCPDDCPEPAHECTVTGKRRGKPMHELLESLSVEGFRVHVIKSRQLAPGVGGYSVGDLKTLQERIESGGEAKWLVGTACRCHGVISAMEVKAKAQT